MSFRYEDSGLTLRLFVSRADALAYPGARDPVFYAVGWLTKNESGAWVDGHGVLPSRWQPRPELLGAEPAASAS